MPTIMVPKKPMISTRAKGQPGAQQHGEAQHYGIPQQQPLLHGSQRLMGDEEGDDDYQPGDEGYGQRYLFFHFISPSLSANRL